MFITKNRKSDNADFIQCVTKYVKKSQKAFPLCLALLSQTVECAFACLSVKPIIYLSIRVFLQTVVTSLPRIIVEFRIPIHRI